MYYVVQPMWLSVWCRLQCPGCAYALHTYTNTHTHTQIYIYIYIYIQTVPPYIYKNVFELNISIDSGHGPGNEQMAGGPVPITSLDFLQTLLSFLFNNILDIYMHRILASACCVEIGPASVRFSRAERHQCARIVGSRKLEPRSVLYYPQG